MAPNLKFAGEAIGPYIPLIKIVTDLANEIILIYETAEYNKTICDTLVERVISSNNAVNTLQSRKQKNEDKFRNKDYYKAFNRYIYVLKDIKEFITDISNIKGFKKYAKAHYIREKYEILTKNYDDAMKDLQFTMAVASEEQRGIDEAALKEDLGEMAKYIEKMDDKLDDIYDEIKHMRNHINDKDDTLHGINKINSKELTQPARGNSDDKRGKDPKFVIKKIYQGQDVACKFTEEEIETSPQAQRLLEILKKLSVGCKRILKFYGISTIENRNVMVFDWAERGTLRELYEKRDIKWHYKVRIAREICRGLIFLQHFDIFHHDLRCKNILMTESLEPKIYNFELARSFDGKTTMLDPATGDILRWMAPEKLTNNPYTTQCEIFSFGMLLWELTFEKIPYKGWEVERIMDHVIKGGRERIKFGTSIPEIYQEEYKNIINDTWKQSPHERISFMKLLDLLDELYNSIHHMFEDNSPGLLPDKSLDLDGSKESDADLELPDEDPIEPVISLEEGIQAFENKEHQKAWKCFEFHAGNNNTTAKYWKGRYLWEGYLESIKGREKEGKKLLKEAADEGNSDAQLRYAFTFKLILDKGNNQEIFLEYLKKAAIEGNNPIAQFNLGDIYYKGKCNTQKNEVEGIKWLRKAALQENSKAIDLLHKFGKDLYD
ncbi:kinase-like domain-containing protein [Glomus cerebriforme]|uniref:Kinase-like domain-containing protein n=1 Tax=Glomus cerebriforme TaxID=658196 RepID=A0A397TA10_9GLOM|nr:kinase-like domain-containing protein [Glomus cerebriforme]